MRARNISYPRRFLVILCTKAFICILKCILNWILCYKRNVHIFPITFNIVSNVFTKKLCKDKIGIVYSVYLISYILWWHEWGRMGSASFDRITVCHMVDMEVDYDFANMEIHRMFKNQLTTQKKKKKTDRAQRTSSSEFIFCFAFIWLTLAHAIAIEKITLDFTTWQSQHFKHMFSTLMPNWLDF